MFVSVTARRGVDSGSSERCARVDAGLLTLPRSDPLGQSRAVVCCAWTIRKIPPSAWDAKR